MIESTAFRVCKKDKEHMFRRKELRSGQQDANAIEKTLRGRARPHALLDEARNRLPECHRTQNALGRALRRALLRTLEHTSLSSSTQALALDPSLRYLPVMAPLAASTR